ncbi:TPA: hypothetical protein ACIPUI_000678 [Citrobacter freundii]
MEYAIDNDYDKRYQLASFSIIPDAKKKYFYLHFLQIFFIKNDKTAHG